jgi:hypothetical protein
VRPSAPPLASIVGALRQTPATLRATLRAVAATGAFVLKVLPMLPDPPVDRLTPRPRREPVQYPTQRGLIDAEIWRPPSDGPHPGLVLCLGVIPVGYDYPQVDRFQEALSRAGFATLLYWSPAMRDYRLVPDDVKDLAMAYEWLIGLPFVDAARSGFIGTCVGGSYVLMAAASPRVRQCVSFVAAFAPFGSMWTLARDIASATWTRNGGREPWPVDPLSRKVFVHSMTDVLEPDEAAWLREALAEPNGACDPDTLSDLGKTILPLLQKPDEERADAMLHALPADLQARLDAMSPLATVTSVQAPVVVVMHDRDDPVIPQSESLRLRDAVAGRRRLHYTEFRMFRHLDPTKVRLNIAPLVRELGRFFLSVYRVFRQVA